MALPQQQQGAQQQQLLTMGLQQPQQQQQQPGASPGGPSQGNTTQQQRLQFPQHQLPANLHVQQQLLRMQQQQQGITAKLQGVAAASGVQQRLLHLEQQEQFLQQQQQQQEPEKVHWVQCDRCDKWRVAPYEITLPSWVCEQNTWDRRYASCSVPEQPDPAAQLQQQQQQQSRHQQQFLQQQQLQQQQLLQQQRMAAAGGAAAKPKAKAKAKARGPAKSTPALQRPLQGGNAAPDAGLPAAATGDLSLAPGLIPPAAAAASAAAHVQQSLLHQQLGQQQQRGGAAAAGNLPALQQQLLQQQLQHQMQQAQQQQLLQQLQQQQHQLLQQLQQQPAVVFDNWVQCDACNKWRRAPNPITSEKWFCRMNTWAPQFASCEAPEEPDPAQQEQQQQQNQQRLLEAAAALQRQQQQLQQSAAKKQRTGSIPRAQEAAKLDPKATPPTQLLRQQQLVAAAAASGQRSNTPSPQQQQPQQQQQMQLQQQLQQAKLPQSQQQQHPGSSPSAGAGGQLQQLQLLQQQQLQLLQQQQVRLLDAARRATPSAGAGAPGAPASAATPATGAAAGERREGGAETMPAATDRGGKWLECRSCKKWRRLPPEVDAEALRPKFFCYLNMWDPQHNSCSSPQEPWQQQQQAQQDMQGKAVPAAAASVATPAASLQKPQHQAAAPDANRQDKTDTAPAAAAQQQLPRAPGQLHGEVGAASSLHQQLQEQQLLLLRMQQQQRAAASAGVAASGTKPSAPAGGAATAGTEDEEDGEEDIEGEGDDDEDSEDTGDSSDSESDRGGGGGPPGGAGAGGPSSGATSRGPGAGGVGGAGPPPQSSSKGHPTPGSFPPSGAGAGGVVRAGRQFGSGAHESSSSSCCSTKGPNASRFFDVLIVGGGIAGLAGALHCQRAGVDYQVIEARGRLGGRVWPIRLAADRQQQKQQKLLQQRLQHNGGRRSSKRQGKEDKNRGVWVDAGANYMHGLTGNENDVRLKARRWGCSVYHLATASSDCRVAVVPGETGWENPYYFDWVRGGRRFCLFVVSLAHALFSRLATPVSFAAGQQETGPAVSILKLLQREAAALLKAEEAADPEVAAGSPRQTPCLCGAKQQKLGGLENFPVTATFESLALPSALRGLMATLLRRLRALCSPSVAGTAEANAGADKISVEECCVCHVEGMVVRMLKSRFGFAAPLRDASAAPFAFLQTPALKRHVQRLHNPKTRLLAWPGLQRYAKNLSRAFTERDSKKANAVKRFAAIPPTVSSDLLCMSWRWLVENLRREISPDRLRLRTRVSLVSVSDAEDSAFPCLVRCHTDDDSNEAQELRSRFVLVALPVSLLQQPQEGEKAAAHVTFHPPLPAEKVMALAAVGMGVHNKVILRVAPSDVFWSHATPSFSSPHSHFQYLNLHAYGKSGCILAHLFPPVSLAIDDYTDEEVAQRVLDDLCELFGNSCRPTLIAFVVTRWHADRYSLGSYSYLKPGADMATHWRWLRAPHPLEAPRVAFAGEFCSDSYNQCVDGAFDTGIRAAQSVVQFGLRLHPCGKAMQQQQQQQPPKKEDALLEGERLQQQHRNRRRQNTAKANSRQQRKARGKKDLLDAVEAKARIAASRAEIEHSSVKYCGDDCCPQMDYPDSSHAGFYLTDGSDLTDWDEPAPETGKLEEQEKMYSANTRMLFEKFRTLLRFNRNLLDRSHSRCFSRGSGPAGFAQPAQARA